MGTLIDFVVVAVEAAPAAAPPRWSCVWLLAKGRIVDVALVAAAAAAATVATLSAPPGTVENGMIVTGAIGEDDR